MVAISSPENKSRAAQLISDAAFANDSLARLLGDFRSLNRPAIVVGGAVRDALVTKAPIDLDIEVYGISLEELVALASQYGQVSNDGLDFGVVKLDTSSHAGPAVIDLSIPRTERPTGNNHQDFEVQLDPQMTFAKASARRDFTINAIGFDLVEQTFLDPHNGIVDLENSILRHVSPAFTQDPLRVLRGMQFAARLGLKLAPETRSYCQEMASGFESISTQRRWMEFQKLFTAGVDIGAGLDVLRDGGWLVNFPDLAAIYGVAQDRQWHKEGDVEIHSALAGSFAATAHDHNHPGICLDQRCLIVATSLVHDFGKATHTQILPDGRITSHGHAEAGVEPAQRFLAQIGAPDNLIGAAGSLVREHMCCVMVSDPNTRNVRRLASRLEGTNIEEWALVVQADQHSRGDIVTNEVPRQNWLNLARSLGVLLSPAIPILGGQDLIDAGLTPSPVFKSILDDAMSAQLDGEFETRVQAQSWLATKLTSSV